MNKIGSQDGITAGSNRLRDLDPAGTLLVKGKDGKWPDISTLSNVPVSDWKAWDKWQRSFQILVDDHDAAAGGGGNPVPPTPDTSDAKARLFLAHDPLDCLAAPAWMVPVCTADMGYRDQYGPDVIAQLRGRFGRVEAWCDCRDPTAYETAVQMVAELGLDGPAWGQCETTAEFDHAYANGARRMVGKISPDVMDDSRLAHVASGEIHLAVELYCNCMPWVTPDYRNANAGVGGNCIGIYADAECAYTPVSWYRERGWYVPHRDSVYAVGLTAEDWAALDG